MSAHSSVIRPCIALSKRSRSHILPRCNACGRQKQNGFATSTQVLSPKRLAIIGSGPAGFYAARRLMQKNENIRIDMFEQLPVPFGLVRYGVAPDHPEVKNCQDTFEEVAASDRFTFIGNVRIGSQVPLQVLKEHYDFVLFAYGADYDRLLGVPGEDLNGIYSARAFVGWYNGLPEFEHLKPNLDAGRAVVIGNGNVALDVARILLAPIEDLRKTDISAVALEALSKSKIKKVTVAGRRGPMQAAFTIKELRELLTLSNTGFHFENPDLVPTAEFISKLPRLEQRKYRFSQLLSQGSSIPFDAAEKTWSLLSMASPQKFNSASASSRSLSSIDFEMNAFENTDAKFSNSARVVGTGNMANIPADLAFRSIGYKSTPIPGLSDINVGFDMRRGIIHNDGFGRALSDENQPPTQGMYCTGWVKNGPTGVIATTMAGAFSTADAVLEDIGTGSDGIHGSSHIPGGWQSLRKDSRVQFDRPVSWQDWHKIDAEERSRGKEKGKEREKFTSVSAMLNVIYPSAGAA